jgi:tetratricopeptide (TPR) repeat protein
LAEAVQLRLRVLALAGTRAGEEFVTEAATAHLDLAACRSAVGLHPLAGEGFVAAEKLLEPAVTTNPGSVGLAVALANAYTRHGDHLRNLRDAGAGRKYDAGLAVLERVLGQTAGTPASREAWVNAATARGHLLNQIGRHRTAAAAWAELADRDPDAKGRARAAIFVSQSLLFADDWRAAATHAETLAGKELPGWAWYDVARVWCLVIRRVAADPTLTPTDRAAEAGRAVERAVAALERAKAAGLFRDPHFVRLLESSPEMEPARGKFVAAE